MKDRMKTLSRMCRRFLIRENYYSHGNILVEQAKVIYFPIPKVACSSIKKIYADMLGLKYDLNDIDDSVHEVDFPFVRQADIASSKYDDYLKFAFVRNPWDRIYSSYRSKVMPDTSTYIRGFTDGVFDGFIRYGNTFRCGMSFREFVEAVHGIPDMEADEHFRSQCTTLLDENGNLQTNFVGRFESIDEGWGRVLDHMKLDIQLPRLMQSKRKTYHEVYDDYLIGLVSDRYAQDIDLFKYTFDPDQ